MKTSIRFILWTVLGLLTPCFAQEAFTKITEGVIVNDPGNSYIPSWGDYDGDGWLDLLVANGGNEGPTVPFLYRNDQHGGFVRVEAEEVGELATDLIQACEGSWADYDNDGLPDLFVGSMKENDPYRLYHNLGNGRFERITTDVGLMDALSPMGPWGSAWADYDNDGYVDLYTARGYISYGVLDVLMHNRGDGTFGQAAGIQFYLMDANFGAWGDADNDGDVDLFVPRTSSGNNVFYRNSGDGTFSEDSSAGLRPGGGGGVMPVWADFNNDGYLDLFVVRNTIPCYYYQNNQDGTFRRITAGSHSQVMGIIASAGDYDNDGDLDLFITRGQGSGDPCLLLRNEGDGTFVSVTSELPTQDRGHFTGCAWADYDNDGALDLFVTTVANEKNVLFHNNGNTNAWLTVRLIGTASNRDAIGAKVRVTALIRGSSTQQMRQIGGGSLGDPRAHFGLGDATNVTTLRVEWPSGAVQEFHNLAARQILTITEPARLVPFGPREFQIRCWKGMQFEVQKSLNLQTWDSLGMVTNVTGTLSFQETQGDPQAACCFYRVVSR
jgi:hypothetical protein